MKVLVVEDEIYSRISLMKQLKEIPALQQAEILEAKNGTEGYRLFCSHHPSLLFVDINMPMMNGLELIGMVLRQRPQTKIVIVSGYADFQFAQQAMNEGASGYLLKPVKPEKLTEIVEKCLDLDGRRQEQQDKVSLLMGSHHLTQYFYARAVLGSSMGDFISDNIFAKMFPQYLFLYLHFTDTVPDKQALYQQAEQVCTKERSGELQLMTVKQNLWGIILRDNGNTGKVLHALIRFCEHEQVTYHIGISSTHQDIEELHRSQEEALLSVKSKFLSEETVLYYQDVVSKWDNRKVKIEYDLALFQLHLEQADVYAGSEWVHTTFDLLTKESNASVLCYETLLTKIGLVFQEVQSKRMRQEFDRSAVMSFAVLDYDCLADLLSVLQQQIRMLCGQPTRSGGDDVVNRIVRYLEENYYRDLSLKYLAEHVFFLNPTYLSHLIAEKVGMSYSNYLKNIRMDHAKQILQTQQVTVTEVAALCGYNDTSQFIQVFKRHTGFTPKRYRMLAQASEQGSAEADALIKMQARVDNRERPRERLRDRRQNHRQQD